MGDVAGLVPRRNPRMLLTLHTMLSDTGALRALSVRVQFMYLSSSAVVAAAELAGDWFNAHSQSTVGLYP